MQHLWFHVAAGTELDAAAAAVAVAVATVFDVATALVLL